MKKNNTLQILFFFLISSSVFSQEIGLSSFLIPKELKENANAVIRSSSTEIIIEAVDKMVVRQKRIVTVLNKLGKSDVGAYASYNNDTKIKKISAIVYDALGNKIKKYSKSKFTDTSAVDGGTLYSDSRIKYLEYTPTSYPYTVVFETEYQTSSTAFVIPWFPIEDYFVSIEKSNYKLINKIKIKYQTQEKNFDGYAIVNTSTDWELNYSLKNQKAVKYERNTISSTEFLPILKVALSEFAVKGIKGTAIDWTELGKWEYNVLYKDEDDISESTRSQVLELVKDAKTQKEKAKIVYQFVQNRTRYINVSIGIGGLRPIKSKEVDKVGYGDCKGLTNYTRALLKVVGVESYFTELYAGKSKKNMDYDFPAIHGNHVILNIPNNGNDIWLECTNQTMPFGFLGSFTDDRDVLVITPNGAIKKRTPKYINDDNLQILIAEIQLDVKGNITASIERISKGIQYNNKFYKEDLSKEELKKRYVSADWGYINNLKIEKISLVNNKDTIIFTEKLNVKIGSYASINQENYLFKVNIFNRNRYIPKRYRKRKHPLKIARGYTDIDTFIISFPKGFVVESLPPEKNMNTKFGDYKVTLKKIDESTIKYSSQGKLILLFLTPLANTDYPNLLLVFSL